MFLARQVFLHMRDLISLKLLSTTNLMITSDTLDINLVFLQGIKVNIQFNQLLFLATV